VVLWSEYILPANVIPSIPQLKLPNYA